MMDEGHDYERNLRMMPRFWGCLHVGGLVALAALSAGATMRVWDGVAAGGGLSLPSHWGLKHLSISISLCGKASVRNGRDKGVY